MEKAILFVAKEPLIKRKLNINDFEIVKNKKFEAYKKREVELFEPTKYQNKEDIAREVDEELLENAFYLSAYYEDGGGFKECGTYPEDREYDQLERQEYEFTLETDDGTKFEITVKIKDETGQGMGG